MNGMLHQRSRPDQVTKGNSQISTQQFYGAILMTWGVSIYTNAKGLRPRGLRPQNAFLSMLLFFHTSLRLLPHV
eukprot:1159553-Pelagomonas_calceolata.AAC.17